MISCIFCLQFVLCMQKLYNHSGLGKNFPRFMNEMFQNDRKCVEFTDFDKKFIKQGLWKNLWKV